MDTLLQRSAQLWQATLERDVETLSEMVHKNARFVHMGATLNREQEFAAFRDGVIVPKKVEIQQVTPQSFGDTAVVLTQLQLTAAVNGEAVTNPFVVTEVYQQEQGQWQLVSLAYTRIIYA